MKFKIKPRKLVHSDDVWESWFAWRPVRCEEGYLVWMDYVYRNWRTVRGLKRGRIDHFNIHTGIPDYHGHWNYKIKPKHNSIIKY